MNTQIASRNTRSAARADPGPEKEPTRVSSRRPVKRPEPEARYKKEIMDTGSAGAPPASSVPPKNSDRKAATLVVAGLLLSLLLIGIILCLGALQVDFLALLEWFNALRGRDLVWFWAHLVEILFAAVGFPMVLLFAAGTAFREGKSLAKQALETLSGAVRLCGVILAGTLKAVFNPDNAAPDSAEDPALREEVIEVDPLFPDELIRDARNVGRADGRTKIKK